MGLTKEELKKKRVRMGKTQRELAEYLGYKSWDAVSRWENGHRPIPQTVVLLLKDVPLD